MPKISEDKKKLNRKKILAVSKALFSEHGYHLVSVNDICEQAKISKGAFYIYFESKEELFLELAKEMDNRKVSLAVEGESLEDELLMIWDLVFGEFDEEDVLEYRMFMEFWMESYRIHSLHDILEKKSATSFDLVKGVIKKRNIEEFSDGQIDMFIRAFWSQAEGLMMYYLVHQKTPTKEEIAEMREFMKHYVSYLSNK